MPSIQDLLNGGIDPASLGLTPDSLAALQQHFMPQPISPDSAGAALPFIGQAPSPDQSGWAPEMVPGGELGNVETGWLTQPQPPAEKDPNDLSRMGSTGQLDVAQQGPAYNPPGIDVAGWEKKMGAALGISEDAAKMLMDANRQYTEKTHPLFEHATQVQNETAQQLEDRQKQYNTEYNAKLGEYNRAVDDFMNTKIDPDHWYASRTTSGKIGAVLGAVFGGLGTATGNPNTAMGLINHFVDQDIEVQKTGLEQKKVGIAAKQNALGFMRDKLKDDQVAILAHKDAILGGIETQLKDQAAQLQGSTGAANAMTLLGKIGETRANVRLEASSIIQQEYLQRYQADMQHSLMTSATVSGRANFDAKRIAIGLMTIPPAEKKRLLTQLDDAEELQVNVAPAWQALSSETALGSIGRGTPVLGYNASAQSKADRARLIAYLRKRTGIRDVHILEDMIPHPRDNPTTLNMKWERVTQLSKSPHTALPAETETSEEQ